MLKRVKKIINDEIIEPTLLTSRLLERSGIGKLIPEEGEIASSKGIEKSTQDKETTNASVELKIEEAVAYKNRIIKDWENKHSEELLREIDILQNIKVTDVPLMNLKKNPELQLLKVLAVEKGLFPIIDEVEDIHSVQRSLGKYQLVLYLNNFGVLEAKKQHCHQALACFKEAIRASLELSIRLKAPYYNCVLLFEQLKRNRLIFQTEYLDILSEIEEMVDLAINGAEPQVFQDFQKSVHRDVWDDKMIENSYQKFAKFAHDFFETQKNDLYASSFAYIIPELDTFASFGDVPDIFNRQEGLKEFQQGIATAEKKIYKESIEHFQRAKEQHPELSIDAEEKISQVLIDWRNKIDHDIAIEIKDGNYDKAERMLLYLPDERLKRKYDDELMKSIHSQKYNSFLDEAENLINTGKHNEAKLKYVYLLGQIDLEETLRKHISDKLREMIKIAEDDAERLQIIEDLNTCKVAKEVVSEFEKYLEDTFGLEYHKLKDEGKYADALRKIFWSMLISDRVAERQTKIPKAIHILKWLNIDPNRLDSINAIQDFIFKDIKEEIKEWWKEQMRKEKGAAEFKKLDSERDIRKKDFKRLLQLIDGDELPHKDSQDYLLAKSRLLREQEAAEHFEKIIKEYEAIVIETDKQKRDETIRQKIQGLETLAISFASSEGREEYSNQNRQYADELRKLLRIGNIGGDLQKMNNDSYNQESIIIEETSKILKEETDPHVVLEKICNFLKTYHSNSFIEDINKSFVGWIKNKGRVLYQTRIADIKNLQEIIEYVDRSLNIISDNLDFLPTEIKNEFNKFLEDLRKSYEPKVKTLVKQSEEQVSETLWEKIKKLFRRKRKK